MREMVKKAKAAIFEAAKAQDLASATKRVSEQACMDVGVKLLETCGYSTMVYDGPHYKNVISLGKYFILSTEV